MDIATSNKQQTVYGIRPVIEAIESGKQIDKILIQNGLGGSLINELRTKIKEAGLTFQFVPIEKLNRTVRGANHQGVVALISAIEYQSVYDIVPKLFDEGRTPTLLMLDRVTDVRNLGAIARTAECTGVDAIIVPSHGSAQINEDAIKTSSGALLRIPVCREDNLKTVINFAKQSGLQICAATEKGHTLYTEVDFTLPTLLIMGAEETGISNDLLKISDVCTKLPIVGEVQSLNVSVATGVFLYEILRQRN